VYQLWFINEGILRQSLGCVLALNHGCVEGSSRRNSTYFRPRLLVEVSDHLHALTALPLRKYELPSRLCSNRKRKCFVKGKGKVVPGLFLVEHHAMKTYCGSGGIASRILDLGTRWRCVVSFTTQPLYLQGKSPWYPLDRRLGGPQSRSGRGGEEKNPQPPPGIEP
jgi:hypothetical protein